MFDPLQSADRDKHSTEIILIKVHNDIISALDEILLFRLCNDYGISGDALDRFRPYLTGRI